MAHPIRLLRFSFLLRCTAMAKSTGLPVSSRSQTLALSLLLSAGLIAPFAIAEPSPPADSDRTQTAEAASHEISALAQLGRRMFFDPSLSGSGQLSCASCHSPDHAYGAPNDLPVQLGGVDMQHYGTRAVPSLKYLEHTPNFSIGPTSEVPDNDLPPPSENPEKKEQAAAVAAGAKGGLAPGDDKTPQGGMDWDGRADTVQEQALGPLLDPNEMANKDKGDLLERIKKNYGEDLKRFFGPTIFQQPDLALSEALFALARFQAEDQSFHPYDSKYDAYLVGEAQLTDAEMRGLKLFEDPKKGNCASCHIDKASTDGFLRPAFTDYEFEALAAPRNMDIPANQDPSYYDLGLCGPTRTDYANSKDYCGLFKTPSLRNVAEKKRFFHNGVFHSLEDVMHFYVERETKPEKWYPKRVDGQIDKYDDIPKEHHGNVDIADAPFDRKQGDKPALDDAEIADVVAFLKTLSDGYKIDTEANKTSRVE